ncbi:MAG: endonuclease/exonuclease/phosphatase family protein [Acholeplasmataceae bacterium]
MKQNKIMSFNLRVDVASDLENAWPYRKDRVIKFLQQESADVIAFQEVRGHMLDDLKDGLNQYDVFVMPRDESGESVPLFIKKGFGRLIDSQTFWLTDTPTIESKINGCHFTRISTYVILEIANYGILGFFNVHLDYASDEVTHKQAEHLLNYINHLKNNQHFKTIILGDFNMTPDTKTIHLMRTYYSDGYDDGNQNLLTFHNFQLGVKGKPIDYIFTDKTMDKSLLKIHQTKNIEEMVSDHYPISIQI